MAANPIETLRPGEILADAAVSEFIKAMGLSIAEAQKALDLNSIAQVAEYVEPRPGLNGQSLMQLGLSPPFYHYQHADLSVSMQLTMRVGTSEAFGIGANLSFGIDNRAGPTSNARLAQITLKTTPATVKVGADTVEVAANPDLTAAANTLADQLRKPTGKFDRVFVSSGVQNVAIALDPTTAKNPVVTRNASAV